MPKRFPIPVPVTVIATLIPWFGITSQTAAAGDTARLLDDFAYRTAAEARRTWRAKDKSPGVQRADHGVRFPLPFASGRDRVYWDRAVSWDLTPFTSFELDLSCEVPASMRRLGLYFKSGGGWYVCNKPVTKAGRTRLFFPMKDFSTEGRPAGWNRIEAIRLSPWKGADVNGTLTAHQLRAVRNGILLVKGTVSAPNAAERTFSARVTDRISRWLSDTGVPHAIVSDEDVTPAALRQARIVLLCYNPNPLSSELRALRGFVERGGALVVFYSASPELAGLLHLKLGDYQRTDTPGRWESFVFREPRAWHVPRRVRQESMNIRPVYPADGSARVIAWWENAAGKRSKDPAWVASPRGAWMSHILLEGDNLNKRRMLLGVLGHYEPALWASAARQAVAQAGRVGPSRGLDESFERLNAMARSHPEQERIEGLVKRARTLARQVNRLYADGHYPEAVEQADKLHRELLDAYALAQRPRPHEFRGVWEHDGVGWYPGNWSKTCRILARSGMTAVLPNMLWGGLAHYPSKVLPVSHTCRRYGDQLAQCLKAAHEAGLEVHVWVICWTLQGAPPEFLARMKKEGRVQLDRAGKPTAWLNPADPANARLALDALKEMVSRYPVDGIHLDYVRYPGAAVDRGAKTRQRFEEWLGRKAAGWPRSAESGGPLASAYRRFRADQITLFVRAVHQQVRPLRPGLKISAAVFKNYPECINTVGQDWGRWLKEGYVDFVSPMNYTTDTATFRKWTETQTRLPKARDRILPGLGITANESQLRPDQAIDQIVALREAGAPGFILFDLSPTLRDEILPRLARGMTRRITE